jgi:hypothetical protein
MSSSSYTQASPIRGSQKGELEKRSDTSCSMGAWKRQWSSSDKLAFVNDDGKETPLGFRQRLDAPDDDFPDHMITSWPICLLKVAKRADRNRINMTGLMLQRTGGFEFRRIGIFLDNYRGRKRSL